MTPAARHIIAILLLPLSLGGCSDNDRFRINGTIEGKPTMNVRVSYIADGVYRQDVTAARDGVFEYFGSATQPALIEVTDNDFRPLARLYARNGETFEITVDRDEPFGAVVTGNEVSERLSRAYIAAADSLAAGGRTANAAVARYVAANPGDIVSTLLMLTVYDASVSAADADSLMSAIDISVRPGHLVDGFNQLLSRLVSAADTIAPFRYGMRHDSIAVFTPSACARSLIVIDRSGQYRRDSIEPMLRRLSRRRPAPGILELDQEPYGSLLTSAGDTLPWRVGRVPGGVAAAGAEQLGIPGEPFFIVCDSAGRQLYRGPHAAVAESIVTTSK